QDVKSILNKTLSYRGLTEEDITIAISFEKGNSPRNYSRLLLPVVKELMINPLNSFDFLDNVLKYKDLELEVLVNEMFKLNNYYKDNLLVSYINHPEDFDQLEKFLIKLVKNSRELQNEITKTINPDDMDFLEEHILSIYTETISVEDRTTDIFQYNIARDSSINVSKKTLDILSKIESDQIIKLSIQNLKSVHWLFSNVKDLVENGNSQDSKFYYNKSLKGNFLYYYDKNGIRIAIGDEGKNIYTGNFDIIIDPGGDDVYSIKGNENFSDNFNCIIDLAGNDYYSSNNNFTLAGSVFSSGIILDKEGDDIYKGANVTIGSAICGIGLLYDESGNDTYYANSFSIGAAAFGIGLLIDRNGNDIYSANTYSQGFGMTEGIGAIIDNTGNDSYLINSLSLDIGRYEDHFVSMCQGYGLGMRPYYAGGIGLIIEGGGNDVYNTDIFGQGGAYWYSLGAIVDNSGHDKYNSYQYAQGSGIHLAVGLLKDLDGWDFYSSNGVSQGCGHDYGFGFLYDVKGNDNYSAYSLSQGVGSANGIGILIDESGRDGYLNKEPENTSGYGNPRREYGSLGILLDASGTDFYSVGELDNLLINSSTWGVSLDYYLEDLPSQQSGDDFKVDLDLSEDYDLDDYFIMAKTIEPRFSKWNELGVIKLIEDSIGTANLLLTKLNTEDHRETFLMRNLIEKITYAISTTFINKLNEYKTNNGILTPDEVSLMAYLFGITKNPIGKDVLLELTYNDDIGVRSSALIALGKLNIDSSDVDFINKVSQRLVEMANEHSDKKIYNTNIAFAFNNYKVDTNILTLLKLLEYDFFGVRFLTADALKKYEDTYFNYLKTGNLKELLLNNPTSSIALIYSLDNLSNEYFKSIIEMILTMEPLEDAIKYNLINLLQKKSITSGENDFTKWTNEIIENLKNNLKLKVK
ncbi:hypothetical protein ACFLSV_07825, partial [Bacteroidota bacterium]